MKKIAWTIVFMSFFVVASLALASEISSGDAFSQIWLNLTSLNEQVALLKADLESARAEVRLLKQAQDQQIFRQNNASVAQSEHYMATQISF